MTTNIEVIDSYIAMALEDQDEEVFQSQIDALRAAREAGEVTRADVDAAFAEHIACLEAAGIEYNIVEEETLPGSRVYLPGAEIPAPDPNSNREVEIDDACSFGHDIYIKSAYSQQPWVLAAEDRVWTSQAVRDCLASHGYPPAEDATAAEIEDLDFQYTMNAMNDSDFEPCV